MILIDAANSGKLLVQSENNLADFTALFVSQTGKPAADLHQIREIKVAGCAIDSFGFLKAMPGLRMIYFLDCESGVWQTLSGTPDVISLGLHNLKAGKKYLSDASFLRAFSSLEYLYVNMLGVGVLPELPALERLHTVMGCFRNENAIKGPYDFAPFRRVQNLQIFSGCCAVDRHRIPAEAFLPILENPSLRSFTYAQMFSAEDKKLAALIARVHPSLAATTLCDQKLMEIRRTKYAG